MGSHWMPVQARTGDLQPSVLDLEVGTGVGNELGAQTILACKFDPAFGLLAEHEGDHQRGPGTKRFRRCSCAQFNGLGLSF